MAVNETIVTGRKFRKCIDAATKAWQRISFWTKSSDVEFEDGKNAETKLGAIDGITDSLEDTSSRMAASAKAVSTLNNNLGGCQLTQEGNDFYIVGADSVRKKLGSGNVSLVSIFPHNINGAKYTFSKAVKHGVIVSGGKGSSGAGFGRINAYTNITIKTLAEKTYSVEYCVSAYEFTNAQIGSTVNFLVSAGGGVAIIELD